MVLLMLCNCKAKVSPISSESIRVVDSRYTPHLLIFDIVCKVKCIIFNIIPTPSLSISIGQLFWMTSFGDRDFVRVFLATHLCMLSVVSTVDSPHVFDLKISTYEQQSKRNDDEGTTVSCCAPYLICLCISNFYCVAHPCLTNVIYIQTTVTVSVYTIYERQANLIK